MNKELHELHHAVRDLSSDHLNLETSFNREVERRDGYVGSKFINSFSDLSLSSEVNFMGLMPHFKSISGIHLHAVNHLSWILFQY